MDSKGHLISGFGYFTSGSSVPMRTRSRKRKAWADTKRYCFKPFNAQELKVIAQLKAERLAHAS